MDRRVVTVFGGSGFIGRHLVRRLVRDGWVVRAAVRDVEAALFLKTAGDIGQVVPFPADITKPDSVAAAVAGAEAVVNLVGILYERGKRTFQAVHVDGAATVAAEAAKAGAKRLVQMSAIGADPDSEAAYGRTKAAGEAAVRAAFADATVIRPSVVFGPEDKFFNLFAMMTRISPALPVFGCPTFPRLGRSADGAPALDVYGDGGTRMQPVYVGDVAEAIARILGDVKTAGKTYEVGGPRVYSFKELMELVLSETRRKRLLVPVPFGLVAMKAWFLEKLPEPLLTRDQVRLLQRDNVVAAGALTLADLGIEATAAEFILPEYLSRYRAPAAAGRRAG